MTVKGPEAIDPAPAGPERRGGRPETAILPRDAKAAQPPAENSRGRPLREGDRDAVVLRSHRTHRGLRGRPAGTRGRNRTLAPCSSVKFEDTPTATGPQRCRRHPSSPCRVGHDRRRLRLAAPTASPPSTAEVGQPGPRLSDVGEVSPSLMCSVRIDAASSGAGSRRRWRVLRLGAARGGGPPLQAPRQA